MNMLYPIVMATTTTPPFKWWLDFFSNKSSFLYNRIGKGGNKEEEESEIAREGKEEEEGAECAVCLCSLGDGDDIKELRCDHMFHRVCLERWFGYGRVSCPLCRRSIDSCFVKKVECGEDLICFSFCSSSTSANHKSSWWLR